MPRHRQIPQTIPHRWTAATVDAHAVTDDLGERLPVTDLELDLLERYLGSALDEFLKQESATAERE
jgi:hypothetical protein